MDEINEPTYRLYRVVSNEDGECEYEEVAENTQRGLAATITQVLADWRGKRHGTNVYVMEQADEDDEE